MKPGRPAAGAPSQRQLRVAEEIRHVLADIFTRAEFRDPDLAAAHLTVAEVRVGPDLKRATAFISRLGRGDVTELLPALKRAVPYLRGQMAKSLRLRVVPDLVFEPDIAIEYASHVDDLLRAPAVARDLPLGADQRKE